MNHGKPTFFKTLPLDFSIKTISGIDNKQAAIKQEYIAFICRITNSFAFFVQLTIILVIIS
jgi:hypothetical protein